MGGSRIALSTWERLRDYVGVYRVYTGIREKNMETAKGPRIWGSGFRVMGLRFEVWALGFRVGV